MHVIDDDFNLLRHFKPHIAYQLWLKFGMSPTALISLSCSSSSLLGINGILAWVLHNSCQAGRGQECQREQGIRNRTQCYFYY